MMYDIKTCGKRIAYLRLSHSISQTQLSAALEISNRHLCNIEAGRKGISIDLLIDIAEYFHVSLDYLITGAEYRCYDREQVQKELQSAAVHIENIRNLLDILD